MAEETVASLLETQPHASETLSRCVGYVVIDMQVAKIPIFGAGGGPGVVVDRRTNARSYIKVSRFEIGSGMGSQKFKVIIVFDDPELFERAASGAWHYDAGAEMAAGTTAAESAVNREGSGYHAYKIIESGAVAAVTVRLARAKPYLQ